MPGLSATVGEQIEALRRVAGEKAVKLIRREPDPVIGKIVEGWPRNFDTSRARGEALLRRSPSTTSSASISRTNSAARCNYIRPLTRGGN